MEFKTRFAGYASETAFENDSSSRSVSLDIFPVRNTSISATFTGNVETALPVDFINFFELAARHLSVWRRFIINSRSISFH